ncbi:hypothetical protein ATANTOWER_024014 [Ataeniobius toweri]|uniref:Uncharacterized protein n=1 Tax=Ataeniobius toweri TaxID=208326 RepID=A0ABU7AHA2_9TELE|nr:hypothetical protein [Ataeniobius toweri]
MSKAVQQRPPENHFITGAWQPNNAIKDVSTVFPRSTPTCSTVMKSLRSATRRHVGAKVTRLPHRTRDHLTAKQLPISGCFLRTEDLGKEP